MTAAIDHRGMPSNASGLRKPSVRDLAHIPGTAGWPIVGNTLTVVADPVGSARRAVQRYGPVYRDYVLGRHVVSMLGPEANELVLLDPERLFSSRLGWEPLLGRLFPRGLMLRDFDEHRLHRRALSVAFKAGPMRAYLAALDRTVSSRVRAWASSGAALRFYPALKQLTLDLAATCFLDSRGEMPLSEAKRAFVAMVAASVGVVRVPVPGSKMYAGVRGRARIVELLSREVPVRREGAGDDIFSSLCRATDEDGGRLTAEDIVDHMSFLMMAAHDTLASSMTSLVWLLTANPDWQERLRAEAAELGLAPGEPLPFERLGEMPLAEMAFKEAMRINPPVPALPRRALRAFEFGGFEIPAGTDVGINLLFTHHMEAVWPDPERFDPLRFTDDAVRRRHRFAWVPFGGGAHMCLGLHFATMQTKCILYRLLRGLHIEAPAGYRPRWALWPIPKPLDGLPVTVRPIG